MIRVVNLKDYKPINNEELVKVDRSTFLGNPFYMRNESERDNICDQYKKWLTLKIKEKDKDVCFILNKIWKKVNSGKNIALGCHCHPRRCHADIIKNIIESRL